MARKGQVASIPANDMGSQRIMIASLFAIAARSLQQAKAMRLFRMFATKPPCVPASQQRRKLRQSEP
jgi:hypothetical protein